MRYINFYIIPVCYINILPCSLLEETHATPLATKQETTGLKEKLTYPNRDHLLYWSVHLQWLQGINFAAINIFI